jgi:tetratricopeptide (TPR) repeat protein
MILAPTRPEEGRRIVHAALETALEHALPLASSGHANLSDLCLQQDRYAESLAHVGEMLVLAHRVGNRRQEWFAISEMTYALTMLSRWDEALARYRELPEEVIGRVTTLSSPLSGILDIHLHRGELDQARQLLARFQELGQSADVQEVAAYDAATAAVRLAEGIPAEALAAAERGLQHRGALGIASQDVKLSWVRGVEAALALGDVDKATELLAIADELPVGLRPPLVGALTSRFRARIAGDDPAADSHFTAAEAELRALDLSFHLAVVQLEHGEWLLSHSRGEDAAPYLEEARDTFARLQATPWLDRVEAALPSRREPEPATAG